MSGNVTSYIIIKPSREEICSAECGLIFKLFLIF